jgi:hypothetical protein
VAVEATAWNVVMVILIWVSETELNIPPNNLFVYTAALISTIVLQNYLSLNRNSKEEKQDDKIVPSVENGNVMTELRLDTFLRQRKTTKISYGYQALGPLQTGQDFHEPHFIAIIEKSQYGVVPRYLEYMVTAPLLFVGLYVNSIPFDLTWKLQVMFIAIFVCNGLGIALHQAVLLISNDPKADNMSRFSKAANYFFLASWLSLIVAFYLFIWSLKDFLLTSNDTIPDWVRSLIWLVLVMYSSFGFIASRYYLPKMMWGTPISDPMYKWFYFYLDLCSLFVKLPVAWTIYIKGTTVLCDHGITCPS